MKNDYSPQNPPNVGDKVTIMHNGRIGADPTPMGTVTVDKITKTQITLSNGRRYALRYLPALHEIGGHSRHQYLIAADNPEIQRLEHRADTREALNRIIDAVGAIRAGDTYHAEHVDLTGLETAIADFKTARARLAEWGK